MIDFFSKYSEKPEQHDKTAEAVLVELSEQIDSKWKGENIDTYVTRTVSDMDSHIKIVLHLNTGYKNKFYNYRFIEIEQPLDKNYPVRVTAFQTPPTTPKQVINSKELENELVEIIGNPRTRIVKNHLLDMGENIKQWLIDAEEEN